MDALFIAVTSTLILIDIVLLVYLLVIIHKLRVLKKQIKLHKETTLSSKYIMAYFLPILALNANIMIAIDLVLFLMLCSIISSIVYFNEEYDKLNKEYLKLLEENNNGTMES